MSTFWTQLLLNAIVGGTLSTIVGVVVGFLFKRWLRSVFEPQQQATTAAAHKAARSADQAASAARTTAGLATVASEDARTAGDNSRDASTKLDVVGARLVDVLAENRGMAGRLDDVLAAYLHLRALVQQEGIEIPAAAKPAGLLIPASAADADDPASATGRHRLHTQRFPIIDEGDHP
jgi:hypothetical protein